METNVIHCMDNVLGLRKHISDSSVDLTVTSPPYDDLRDYKGYKWDFKSLAKELFRVTKDGGVVVWVVGDQTINGSETGASFKQALYFKDIGFNLHDTMIYEKSGCGACGSNKSYLQNFEYMFVVVKKSIKTYNLIYDRENKEVGEMATNTNRDKFNADNKRKYRKITTKKKGRRFNIWKLNQTDGQDIFSRQHSAPFPEQLAKDHILSWSNEGDIILDPFMGSGTTAKMADILNRKWIGFEISQEYINIAYKRIGQLNKKYYKRLPKEERPSQLQMF